MRINNVFSVGGVGIVVTGTIKEGEISVADNATVYRIGKPEITVSIRGISQSRNKLNTATVGQEVALLLDGIGSSDVQSGDEIAK
jgi:selenocysteine-specific elongation factor